MQRLALIGLGASGLFALKELAGQDVEVHVFDVGPSYEKRYACPIDQGKLEVCPPKACSYCAPGQSAGSWNDFKVILSASPVIGGRLYDLVGGTELQKRLDVVRQTILSHAPLRNTCRQTKQRRPRLDQQTRHTGWHDLSLSGATALRLGQRARLSTQASSDEIQEAKVSNICISLGQPRCSHSRARGEKFAVQIRQLSQTWCQEKDEIFDLCIVISVGRGGAHWLTQQEFYKALDIYPGQVDIGIRVETSLLLHRRSR
jgi:uncharacterized FAD-dependent dehydrogenase